MRRASAARGPGPGYRRPGWPARGGRCAAGRRCRPGSRPSWLAPCASVGARVRVPPRRLSGASRRPFRRTATPLNPRLPTPARPSRCAPSSRCEPQPPQLGVDPHPLQGALESVARFVVLEVRAGGGRLDAPAADAEAVCFGDHLPTGIERVEAMQAHGARRWPRVEARCDSSSASISAAAQLGQPGAGVGGDGNRPGAGGPQRPADARPRGMRPGQVLLGDDHRHRPQQERRVMLAQLGLDGVPIADRVRSPSVDNRHQHAGPLRVAQEGMSQPTTLGGTLDQARQVGDHDSAPRPLDHAQVGPDGGERIVTDLGRGGGQRRQQRGLPGIGRSDQSDVGDQLQLEFDPARFAGLALLRVGRRLVGGADEVDVAASAAPAACDHQPLPGRQQLPKECRVRLGLVGSRRKSHHGPGWNGHDHVVSVLAVRLATRAGTPGLAR